MTTELVEFLRSPAAVEATADTEGRLLRPGAVVDGMEVVAFLGAGSTAEVWRVRKEGRDLALKMLRSDVQDVSSARERFLTEARLLMRLGLPGVVKAYALKGDVPSPYFTLDFLHPLPERPSERTLLRILDDVCAALGGLHRQGIIHRDIKPGNVLLDRSGRAVVADLGLVHLKDDGMASAVQTAGEHNLTVAGGDRYVGTPGYAAPEQLSGQEVSPASDIYSLGVMANRLLEGDPPRAWRAFIRRATSAVPSLRYADMRAVRRALLLIRLRKAVPLVGIALAAVLVGFVWPKAQRDSSGPVQEEVAPVAAVVEKEAGVVAFGMALGEVDDIPSQAKVKDGLRLVAFAPAETVPAYALFQGYRKFVEPLAGDPSRGRTVAVTATSFIDRLPEAELDRRQVEMSREWAEALKQVQRDLACSFVKQPRQGNDMVWQARLAGSGKVEARFTVAANPDGTYQILRLVTVTTDDAK